MLPEWHFIYSQRIRYSGTSRALRKGARSVARETDQTILNGKSHLPCCKHELLPSFFQINDVHTIIPSLENVGQHCSLRVLGSNVNSCSQHFGHVARLELQKLDLKNRLFMVS